jgi:hypothetical protein
MVATMDNKQGFKKKQTKKQSIQPLREEIYLLKAPHNGQTPNHS